MTFRKRFRVEPIQPRDLDAYLRIIFGNSVLSLYLSDIMPLHGAKPFIHCVERCHCGADLATLFGDGYVHDWATLREYSVLLRKASK